MRKALSVVTGLLLAASTHMGRAGNNTTVWLEDALPADAAVDYNNGDTWNWVSSNPAPYSGSKAHQTAASSGFHQHFFTSASSAFTVDPGDVLVTYVYIDPSNVPSELMLQWFDASGSWEHRAYWGANSIDWGTNGSPSRQPMGPLPPSGQWVRLEVPASKLGLEGSTLRGLAFTLVDGRVTWDASGKSSAASTTPPSGGATNTPPVAGPGGSGSGSLAGSTNMPGVSLVDYLTLELPKVGDTTLHILTPTLLELKLINTKQLDPARVAQWDLVNNDGQFVAPPASAFKVMVNGQQVGVTGVGFKRRPLYAPFVGYDLRIDNSLYLVLQTPVSDNQLVEVQNPDDSLWSSSTQFTATVDPLRYSPAIHVNQEGYLPGYSKKAMVGYYAGSLGEMNLPAAAGFKLVDAQTGAAVYRGSLTQRPDSGYNYSPMPYQQVYEADFTSFNTPGEYRLVVPGMGGSTPFLIDEGVAMSFARAYALGLYHQRCGTSTDMPATRFTHGPCHTAPATVPSPQSAYPFTWNTVAGYANTINADNPPQTAPALTSESAQLFPFVNKGTVDVSGGHHDAGDYSKYTINSAWLTHLLLFTADSLPGVSSLDNLGIPESGDGIPDVLQEAKWEADFLAKMQDADGGFYFLVYPENREYEGNVTPDHGDRQVVWPKTSSATAASVAALAQCASSPLFKRYYPQAATAYLAKAQLGWNFLMNAINQYGQNGIYQKITHYGDWSTDQDEMAWAACEMFLATGDSYYQQKLLSWFDPANPATTRYGWWRLFGSYGNAVRSFAFAARTGRLQTGQLDATFLAKCQAQITAAGDDAVNWSRQCAYGSSFPSQTKAVQAAGWYFSGDQAFDITVAYQLNPKPAYMDALLQNLNYEGGCNPVNVTYITGLGWKRQRDIVSQWAANDTRVLPPSGIPVGNVQAGFFYTWNYQTELEGLAFPPDGASNPYPFYDRWGDGWNVSAEMVHTDAAKGLANAAFLASLTSLKSQPWKPVAGQITVTGDGSDGRPVVAALTAPGLDLSGARITWEALGQEPTFGSTFTFTPKTTGAQWIEAEAQLPDGRRIFASTSANANPPASAWVDDTLPAGASANGDGGDTWNWVNNPAPVSGSIAHQSAAVAGEHQHFFQGTTATMAVGSNTTLYAYVYLDPANLPSEVMLQWSAGGSWEHRAYWGANNIPWGGDGTASRRYMGALPAAGQWVRLEVPADQVGLQGSTVSGMAFTLYDGRATWDSAGCSTPAASTPASSVVVAATGTASRLDLSPGVFTFTRAGDLNTTVTVSYSLAGSAVNGVDYVAPPTALLAGLARGNSATMAASDLATSAPSGSVTIPAGTRSATITITPLPTTNFVGSRTVVLSLATNGSYQVGPAGSAIMALAGNTVPVQSFKVAATGATVQWASAANRHYRIAYKNSLTDPAWIHAGDVTATGNSSKWVDTSASAAKQRFYLVALMN